MSNLPPPNPNLPQTVHNSPQGNWVVAGAPEESEGMKFDLWGLLNRRKWLVFLGIVTGVTLGFVYHYNTDPVYKSEASMSIEPKNPYVAPIGRNEVLPGGQMLSSRHDKFIMKKEFIHNVFKKNEYFKLSSYANMTESEAVSAALDDLDVKPEREEPNIFILEFQAKDQEESKLILNSIITAYNEDLNDKYQDETQKIANEFRSTTEQIFQRLERANDEKNDLRQKYPFISIGQSATLEQLKLKQLDALLVSNKNQLFKLRSQRQWILDSIERGQSEQNIIWILKNGRFILNDREDNQANRVLNTQSQTEDLINQLELQRVDLLQRIGEGHPDIQRIDRRIAHYKDVLRVDQDALAAGDGSLTFGDMVKLYLVKLDLAIREAKQNFDANFNDYVNLTKKVKTITDGQYELRRKDKEIDLIHGWLKQAQTTLAQLDSTLR